MRRYTKELGNLKAGRFSKLTVSNKPELKRAWFQSTRPLKLKYDEPLSKFAFNFNLRRYIKDHLLTLSLEDNQLTSVPKELGRAVQVDSIITRDESALGFSA